MSLLSDGQRLINEQFALVPPHKRGALIAVADLDGCEFGIATKIGDDWQLTAEVAHKWNQQGATATLKIFGSW